MGFDHHREDWEARFEAMAEYADYARKRDKENALASKHGGRVGNPADSGSAPKGLTGLPPREPERGPQQYRCTRDDIDESGGTA